MTTSDREGAREEKKKDRDRERERDWEKEKMMFGSGDNESPVGVGGQMGMIPGLPLQLNPTGMVSGGGGGGGSSTHKEERVPQWSHQETRDFIAIRAELERDFTLAKRNKTLWEAVAAKMKEMGYRRSPEQCKCKWKNLVNRYKVSHLSLSNIFFSLFLIWSIVLAITQPRIDLIGFAKTHDSDFY